MPKWYVYVLRCRDNSLYTGISTDVLARVEKHNAGKGAAYTRSRAPVALVWSKACKTESAARKKEYVMKRWSKAEKEAFLNRQGVARIGSPSV